MMKRTVFLILSFLGILACTAPPEETKSFPQGDMAIFGTYNGDLEQLKLLEAKHDSPIVIIEDTILVPAEVCLCNRDLGGETEDRALGGETEDRDLGGETEDRDLGGETEDRDLGGETEGRDLGGETEDRDLGGETEDRDLGGETEDRDLGGDTEDRDLGGETGRIQCLKTPDESGFMILNVRAGATIQVYYMGVLEELDSPVFYY